jgi:polysaccharide chain length determinant protein (PEP-CTERM system associated)
MNTIYEELRAALYSVWHRRWLALAVAWGVCLLGWLFVAMIPNTYESKARIFVQMDDPLAEQIGINMGNRTRDLERVRQTMTSSANLEKVVRGTKLNDLITTPRQMESTVAGLAKSIKVVSQQDNLFEVTATASNGSLSEAENAKLAQDLVQRLIDVIREENIAGGRGEMSSTLEFMNAQLAERQAQLEAAEQRRLAFDAAHPELAQGAMSVMQRLDAHRAELRGIDADLAAAQSALAAINGQLAGTPASLPGVGAQGGARGALAQAQSDLSAMKSRGLTDNHPDVIAMRNQVNALRVQAQGENGAVGGMPNPAHSSLLSIRAEREANVQSLMARRAAVQSNVSAITSSQFDNPSIAAEAQRISRDYDVLKAQYDKMLQDREQLRLRGEVTTTRSAGKFEVIDPPSTPRGPAAPNRPLLLLGVLVVGIGCGAGAAFAVGQLRSTFPTTAKLEGALGLPVIGAISHTLNDAARALQRKRLRQFVAASAGLGGLFAVLLVVEFVQRGLVA